MLALPADGRYHVMVVGIDQYPPSLPSLRGCVHDAERLLRLLGRLGLPATALTDAVFLAPRAGQRPSVPFLPPTKANLVARLQALASQVAPGDSVLIFYAGHGTQRTPGGTLSSVIVEALVPADAGQAGGDLLYDFELARYLDAISEACDNVTVLLDCCHAAGTTRGLSSDPLHPKRERSVELSPAFLHSLPPLAALPMLPPADRQPAPGRPGFAEPARTIVAACHAHEKAQETTGADEPQGLFSAVLFDLLEAALPTEGGAERRVEARLRWVDIWPQLLTGIEAQNPEQHPSLTGSPARPVLGGPAEPCDLGLALRQTSAGFQLAAGRLLGLEPGALLGVYGPSPSRFSELNSPADQAARIATLRVEQADLLTAEAQPLASPLPRAPINTVERNPSGKEEGASGLLAVTDDRRGRWGPQQVLIGALSLPRGARARLLGRALSLYLDETAAAALSPERLLRRASAAGLQLSLAASPDAAELQLVAGAPGCLLLGDAWNPPTTEGGRGPIAELPLPAASAEGHDGSSDTPTDKATDRATDSTIAALIAAGLHYAQFAVPQRLAALCAVPAGNRQILPAAGLEVDLIDCGGLSQADLQGLTNGLFPRQAMPRTAGGHYALRARPADGTMLAQPPTRFALWLKNRAKVLLFASVFLCNRQGQLEELILDEQIPPGAAGKLIWSPEGLGEPLELSLSAGLQVGVERLAVLACTIPGTHGLETLRQAQTLQEVISASLSFGESARILAAPAPRLPKPYAAWLLQQRILELSVTQSSSMAIR